MSVSPAKPEASADNGTSETPTSSFYRGFFVAEQRKPVKQHELTFAQMVFQGLFAALPIVGLYWLYVRSQRVPAPGAKGPKQGSFQEAMMRSMDPLGRRSFRYTGQGIKFKNVIGIPEELAEVKQYVDFLQNPKRFMRLGARLPKGCLLTGQPGTGKTLLAKAVAGEAGVPFFTCSGADFIEVYAGSGPRRVREIFEEAKKESPSVVFFDEIDAIGSRGGDNKPGGQSGEENRTINQLLAEMDGLQTDGSTVVVFAATNFPENLDGALVREGRFDRKVDIPMPDVVARRDLFEFYLSKVITGDPNGCLRAPTNAPEPPKTEGGSASPPAASQAPPPTEAPLTAAELALADPSVSNRAIAEKLAGLTPGVSPATIATIVNEAALAAAVDKAVKVDQKYLFAAIDDVLVGKKHRNRMSIPTITRVALHEAGHALTAWMLPQQSAVIKLSVVPRGRAAGFTQQLGRESLDHTTDILLFSDICVLLGGRTAESLYHTDLTTGAQDDLQRATQNAMRQFLAFGMSGHLGLISYDYQRVGEANQYQLCSKDHQHKAELESKELIEAAGAVTAAILRDNKEKLHALANALTEKRELSAEDIEKILGKRPTLEAGMHPLARTAMDRFIHGAAAMNRERVLEAKVSQEKIVERAQEAASPQRVMA